MPSVILESRSYNEARKKGVAQPFLQEGRIVITSYEFAAAKTLDVSRGQWDLVVFDEAHRLRNVYKQDGSKRAKALRDAIRPFFKVLLTATPLQNSLQELYGLVSVIDEKFFSDEGAFRTAYLLGTGAAANLPHLRKRLLTICKRTLRRQVQQAGLINYTERCPLTLHFEPSQDEMRLYEAVSVILDARPLLRARFHLRYYAELDRRPTAHNLPGRRRRAQPADLLQGFSCRSQQLPEPLRLQDSAGGVAQV